VELIKLYAFHLVTQVDTSIILSLLFIIVTLLFIVIYYLLYKCQER